MASGTSVLHSCFLPPFLPALSPSNVTSCSTVFRMINSWLFPLSMLRSSRPPRTTSASYAKRSGLSSSLLPGSDCRGMLSPGRLLDVEVVGLEVKPKSLWPKPVLKLFMNDFRLGIVAEMSDQHSSASASASAGTKARPGCRLVEVLALYIACAMAKPATLYVISQHQTP
jgi:hypothetical protein